MLVRSVSRRVQLKPYIGRFHDRNRCAAVQGLICFHDSSMTRGVSEKSLLIGSYTISRDCRFTTFSIARFQKGRTKQRASHVNQCSYELSKFEVTHHQEKCARIRLYVALHKGRFHLVVSGSDAMAIAAVKTQIAVEEYTRQRLQWIHERQSALGAMSVHERSSSEAQYEEVSRALIEWRESVHPFSSFRWNGQENSPAINATDPMDPCLLCEAGVKHKIPIMHFDINGVPPSQARTFADSPIDMEAEIEHCDIEIEDYAPAGRRSVSSSQALLRRWFGSLQHGRAEVRMPHTLLSQKQILACTAELRAWIRSRGEKLNKCDSSENAV